MTLFGQTVEAIEAITKRAGWVRVLASDGTRVEMREARCVELGLRAGAEWTPALAQRCLEAAGVDAIKERALRLLARRAWARRELVARLSGERTEPGLVEVALGELERAGLIDDEAFARQVFEHETARGPGRALLARARLERAGVDPAVIDAVESDLAPDPRAEARALVERRVRAAGPGIDRRRLAARIGRLLGSRGFDEETARSAIDDVLGTIDHEQPEAN